MTLKKFSHKNVLIAGIMLCLVLAFFIPRAGAQYLYSNPAAYYNNPFRLPPPPSPFFRTAAVPTTNLFSTLFPAPVLPTVPAATSGGVGITTLIPPIPVTVPLPASALVVNPLSPLITFNPLSLVGLTFAPIPLSTASVILPGITSIATIPAAPVTVPATLAPSTATTLFSLLSGLII